MVMEEVRIHSALEGQPARFKAFRYQGGVIAVVAVALAALSACTGEPTPRDLNDATPPSLLLTVTASKTVDGGLQTVEFGGDIELTMPGGSVFAKASDDDGVSYVELWMTETRVCGGTKVGPGLAGAPTKRVEGQVTDTSAPSSLSAGHDINTQPLRAGCSYTFEVWGKTANAATQPVSVESLVTRLHLDT